MMEQMIAKCGGEYDGPALGAAIQAADASLRASIQSAEHLSRDTEPEHCLPPDLSPSLEFCSAAQLEAQRSLESMVELAGEQQNQLDELWNKSDSCRHT